MTFTQPPIDPLIFILGFTKEPEENNRGENLFCLFFYKLMGQLDAPCILNGQCQSGYCDYEEGEVDAKGFPVFKCGIPKLNDPCTPQSSQQGQMHLLTSQGSQYASLRSLPSRRGTTRLLSRQPTAIIQPPRLTHQASSSVMARTSQLEPWDDPCDTGLKCNAILRRCLPEQKLTEREDEGEKKILPSTACTKDEQCSAAEYCRLEIPYGVCTALPVEGQEATPRNQLCADGMVAVLRIRTGDDKRDVGDGKTQRYICRRRCNVAFPCETGECKQGVCIISDETEELLPSVRPAISAIPPISSSFSAPSSIYSGGDGGNLGRILLPLAFLVTMAFAAVAVLIFWENRKISRQRGTIQGQSPSVNIKSEKSSFVDENGAPIASAQPVEGEQSEKVEKIEKDLKGIAAVGDPE